MFISNRKGMLTVAVLGALLILLSYMIPAKPPFYSPVQTSLIGLLLIIWAGVSFWLKR